MRSELWGPRQRAKGLELEGLVKEQEEGGLKGNFQHLDKKVQGVVADNIFYLVPESYYLVCRRGSVGLGCHH